MALRGDAIGSNEKVVPAASTRPGRACLASAEKGHRLGVCLPSEPVFFVFSARRGEPSQLSPGLSPQVEQGGVAPPPPNPDGLFSAPLRCGTCFPAVEQPPAWLGARLLEGRRGGAGSRARSGAAEGVAAPGEGRAGRRVGAMRRATRFSQRAASAGAPPPSCFYARARGAEAARTRRNFFMDQLNPRAPAARAASPPACVCSLVGLSFSLIRNF